MIKAENVVFLSSFFEYTHTIIKSIYYRILMGYNNQGGELWIKMKQL